MSRAFSSYHLIHKYHFHHVLEQGDGGWHENRDQIELVLIKKSIKFARAVIKEFEKLNNGKPIEDILTENIKSCNLNEDLADTYSSLGPSPHKFRQTPHIHHSNPSRLLTARYIKDKHRYIAQIMARYCDGSDHWAVWLMCISVVHPQEWPLIDEAFKKDQKGDSLSQFITVT